MPHSNFSLNSVWRVFLVLAVAIGIAGLVGSLIGTRLIPAVLQLGVQR